MEHQAIMNFIKSMIKQNEGNDYQVLQENLDKFSQYLEETQLVEEAVLAEVKILQRKVKHYSQISAQIKEMSQDAEMEEDLRSILEEIDQKLMSNLMNAIPLKMTNKPKEASVTTTERVYTKTYEEPTHYRPVERNSVSSGCSGGYSHTTTSC